MEYREEFINYMDEDHTIRVKVRQDFPWDIEPEARPFDEKYEGVISGIITWVSQLGVAIWDHNMPVTPTAVEYVFLWDEIQEFI